MIELITMIISTLSMLTVITLYLLQKKSIEKYKHEKEVDNEEFWDEIFIKKDDE